MATHTAGGKELFVCGNCKCRRTADEYDVDRHGHRRKGCIPCRLKREGKGVTPGRVCEDCGASHKNRSDNKCNTCRLVKCALCQEGFRRCYQNHKLCHRCFYNPPKFKRTPNPPSATNFHGPSMPVTVEHTPWQDQWHDIPHARESEPNRTWAWGSSRCNKCTDILRACEPETCASCSSRYFKPASAL